MWYRKAAMQGHTIAQYNLSGLYMHGRGVPEDRVEGYVWNSVAAVSAFEMALNAIEYHEEALSPSELSTAKLRAANLLEEIESRLPK